jgi:hypothetical protein
MKVIFIRKMPWQRPTFPLRIGGIASALMCFTTLFGMERGGTTSL